MASFPPPLGSLLLFFKLTTSFHFVVVVVVVVYMCIYISMYMMCMYGTHMYYSQVNVSSESVSPLFQLFARLPFCALRQRVKNVSYIIRIY